jgi:hypothetical protein
MSVFTLKKRIIMHLPDSLTYNLLTLLYVMYTAKGFVLCT